MPKPVYNSRIDYNNKNGKINMFDIWLNQALRTTDSPTFGNLAITGDCTIDGNFYVYGNTSILSSNVIQVKDNILLINDGQTTPGVSLNLGGIQINRGGAPDYQIVYNETDKNLQGGFVGSLRPLLFRSPISLHNGIMIWNADAEQIESRNVINIDIYQASTTNSTSTTSGSLYTYGGMGVAKDMFIGGTISLTGSTNNNTIFTHDTTGSLHIDSTNEILLTPTSNIAVPHNVPIYFGNSQNSISVTSSGNVMTLNNLGNINIVPASGRVISIPNQTRLIFSTTGENIYTDASNNMVVTSSQDIQLNPNNGAGGGIKKVVLPVNTPLAFNSLNQRILADNSNNLNVFANNNIGLNPGTNLDVTLPTNNGVKWGGSGNQRIYSNSGNQLTIQALSDIYITPSTGNVNIPFNTKLAFGNNNNFISVDASGNCDINASTQLRSYTQLQFTNTANSINATTGAVYIRQGGLGVKRNITCEGMIYVNSTNGLMIQNGPSTTTFFYADSSTNYGKVDIKTGDGTFTNPSLEIINQISNTNAESLIQFKAVYDTTNAYAIGRGTTTLNSGRSLTLNLPTYSSYSSTGTRPKFSVVSSNTELFSVESETGNIYALGSIGVFSTQDATNATTAGVVLYGGLGVAKSIYTNGAYTSKVNNTQALLILNVSGDTQFNIDTINNITTINQSSRVFTNNTSGFSVSSDTSGSAKSFVINTKDNIVRQSMQHVITNTTNAIDTSSGSLIALGGMSIQKQLHVGSTGNFYGSINMNNTKITNVQDPVNPQDSATKAYVDLVKQGLYVKDSVQVATVNPLTLSTDFVTGNTIDNHVLTLGDRILIKNQTNAIENGIYTINNSGAPTRTIDVNTGLHATGIFVFIEKGSTNSNTGWICNSPIGVDVIGTNDIHFTQFTGLGQVTAGDGLTKNFNEISVVVDNTSLEIFSDALRIKNTAVGTGLTGGSGSALQTISDQSHVTKLGTINTGTWQANIIDVPYGGTGHSKFTIGNILFGNGNSSLATDTSLFYDSTNKYIGVGTNVPEASLHAKNANNSGLYLESISASGIPSIQLTTNSRSNTSVIGMTSVLNHNDYVTNSYPGSLVIANQSTKGSVQFATNQFVQMTIDSRGNVGIHNTTPQYTLDANGTLRVTDQSYFGSTEPSHSSTGGAVMITGGLAINANVNSSSEFDGGSLTVKGGGAISGDLYIGGTLNCIGNGSNSFAYVTVTATDGAVNLSTGSLVTFGGITIQSTINSKSINDGGSFLTPGGASVGQDLYIGGNINMSSGNNRLNIGNLSVFTSSTNTSANYILAKQGYMEITNNTNNSILTINPTDDKIIINDDTVLQIGGSNSSMNGYKVNYNSLETTLHVIPVQNHSTISIGTNGTVSNLRVKGDNNGEVMFDANNNVLSIKDTVLKISNSVTTSANTTITTDTTGNIYTFGTKKLVIGEDITNSSTGHLTTILSNADRSSSLTFTPNNTSSTLVVTSNVSTTLGGSLTVNGNVRLSGGALHQTWVNANVSAQWIYFGIIQHYTEIDFSYGQSSGVASVGLKFIASVQTTTCTSQHLHYGDVQFDSVSKPVCYVYQDPGTLSNHLFVKVPGTSTTIINVISNPDDNFSLVNEGTSGSPNGTNSGYDVAWTFVYSTNVPSTLDYTVSSLTVEGTQLKVNDNLPIIGYVNSNTTQSRDLGILFQRYQIDNDTGSGDIVSDDPAFIDSLPSQAFASSTQLILSNLASSTNDYYNGWWIKINSGPNMNQVRQIVSYIGGVQHIATVSSPFTTQNPNIGDTVNLYKNTYVANYYDHIDNTFVLGYTSTDPGEGSVVNNQDAGLRIANLVVTNNIPSTNASTGTIWVSGGIGINNTTNATNTSNGGSFTSAGGGSFAKNLLVGNNIGIGNVTTPQEILHIYKVGSSGSNIHIEHDTGSCSYINFVESGSSQFGILNQSNLLSITRSGQPNLSNSALTVTSSGYIGINTTHNITSPLVMKSSNFMSVDTNTDYLGLMGGNTNSDDANMASRIKLFGNSSTTGSGDIHLHTGSKGSIRMFNNMDTEQLRLDSNNTLTLMSTNISTNSTTGALISYGGISIKGTANATNSSSGGALTIGGGLSIAKDMYLGGNLYVTGAVIAGGSVTYPTVSIQSTTNCAINDIYNNNLVNISGMGIMYVSFEVIPNESSKNCQFTFSLPGRTNTFVKSGEVVVSVSGYTDTTNYIPLFNVLGVGIVGTTNVLVKFQSVSTAIHHLQLQCSYTIS